MSNEVIPIGKVVRPYGRVSAIGFTGGERYYWLIDDHGVVSMMPATVIESCEVVE